MIGGMAGITSVAKAREQKRLLHGLQNVIAGERPDHAGTGGRGPRCGGPVAAYEVRGIPALPGDIAACGRPEGHGGQCYSEAAWKRKLEANAAGVLAARARKREEVADAA